MGVWSSNDTSSIMDTITMSSSRIYKADIQWAHEQAPHKVSEGVQAPYLP